MNISTYKNIIFLNPTKLMLFIFSIIHIPKHVDKSPLCTIDLFCASFNPLNDSQSCKNFFDKLCLQHMPIHITLKLKLKKYKFNFIYRNLLLLLY